MEASWLLPSVVANRLPLPPVPWRWLPSVVANLVFRIAPTTCVLLDVAAGRRRVLTNVSGDNIDEVVRLLQATTGCQSRLRIWYSDSGINYCIFGGGDFFLIVRNNEFSFMTAAFVVRGHLASVARKDRVGGHACHSLRRILGPRQSGSRDLCWAYRAC